MHIHFILFTHVTAWFENNSFLFYILYVWKYLSQNIIYYITSTGPFLADGVDKELPAYLLILTDYFEF